MIETINGKAYVKKGDKVYELGGGGAGGINVESAKVGQTIKVKAVDENGKPTEWESADFPEELPVVELTTPIENESVFTAEESAALTAAVLLGKPVIVNCTIMESPSMAVIMNNYAGVGLISIFDQYSFTLAYVEDIGGWAATIVGIREDISERLAEVEQRLDSMPDVSKEGA
jgi:hypothetical protein